MMLGARTGAWSPSGAPLPYLRRVAYLESKSDRGQYIDTGYVVGYDDEVDIEMMPLSYGSEVDYFFGSSLSWDSMFNASVRRNDKYALGAWFGKDGRNIITRNAQTGVKFHFNFSKNGVFFNDVRYFDSGNHFDSVNTCLLFSKHTGTNISRYRTHGRLYNFWIKRNGVLVMSLIPVIDLSGRPCLYNELGTGGDSGNGLLYNKGTGEFTPGPDLTLDELRPALGQSWPQMETIKTRT